jgi:hypothetical protein
MHLFVVDYGSISKVKSILLNFISS